MHHMVIDILKKSVRDEEDGHELQEEDKEDTHVGVQVLSIGRKKQLLKRVGRRLWR